MANVTETSTWEGGVYQIETYLKRRGYAMSGETLNA